LLPQQIMIVERFVRWMVGVAGDIVGLFWLLLLFILH